MVLSTKADKSKGQTKTKLIDTQSMRQSADSSNWARQKINKTDWDNTKQAWTQTKGSVTSRVE